MNYTHKIYFLFLWCLVGSFTLSKGQECPRRDLDQLELGRSCRKSCQTDIECKGELKRCACDNICGLSCFNPDALCADPPPINNGIIQGTDRSYGSTITYTCNDGFVLNGSNRRTCRSDRKWSGVNSTCIAADTCEFPQPRNNAFYSPFKENYAIGDTLNVNCRSGFKLTTPQEILATCRERGVWDINNGYRSFLDIFCNPVNCGHPRTPRHGYIAGNSFVFGSRVEIRCDSGYELKSEVRQNIISCTANGNWVGAINLEDIPNVCVVRTCPEPVAPDHGTVASETNEYSFGSQVTYNCNNGYRIVGSMIGRCNENTTWGEVPRCEPDYNCDFEAFDAPTCSYSTQGWQRTFVSSGRNGTPGFVLQSSRSTTSSVSNFTSPIIQSSIGCLTFFYTISRELRGLLQLRDLNSRNRRLWSESLSSKRANIWYGVEIQLTSNSGRIQFALIAPRRVRDFLSIDDIAVEEGHCENNCQPNPCRNNGRCTDRKDDFECTCRAGYAGKTCSQELFCDVLAPPRFGFPDTNANRIRVGGTVRYNCRDGYELQGNAMLTCQETLRWSSAVPRCLDLFCNVPAPPQFGFADTNTNRISVGGTLRYNCRDGYELQGNSLLTCQETLRWSSDVPRCVEQAADTACPDGFVYDFPYCFKSFDSAVTHATAKENCASLDASLAFYKTTDFRSKLSAYMNQYVRIRNWHWIGLHSTESCTLNTLDLNDPVQFNCNSRNPYICMKWSDDVQSVRVESNINALNGIYSPIFGNLNLHENRLVYYQSMSDRGIRLMSRVYVGGRSWEFVNLSGLSFYRNDQSEVTEGNWFDRNNQFTNIQVQFHDGWLTWASWSLCSRTCGRGLRSRTRSCEVNKVVFPTCKGANEQVNSCNTRQCLQPTTEAPTRINPCNSNPCQNGGSCILNGRGYLCLCPRHASGLECEIIDDDCFSSPCQNGGTCRNTNPSYTCDCPPEFGSRNCDKWICRVSLFDIPNGVRIFNLRNNEVYFEDDELEVGCADQSRIVNIAGSRIQCSIGGIWTPIVDIRSLRCV